MGRDAVVRMGATGDAPGAFPHDEHRARHRDQEPEREEGGKAAKRERKRRQDAHRHPDGWERFRIVTEAISEARQVVEISDHRARYALVIIGVLNAAVLVFIARWDLLQGLSGGIRFWLIGLVIVYAILTFGFVLHAIDCLRPRPLKADARGLLHWEAVSGRELAELEDAWSRVRLDEINAEAVAVFHTLAGVVAMKYRALRRLYQGLVVLVVLSAVILGMSAALTLGR